MGAPEVAPVVFNFDYSLLYPTYTPLQPRAGKAAPSPPWDVKAVTPPQSELVKKALAARTLIDTLSQEKKIGKDSGDYAELFALYNGLTSLDALAKRADAKGVSSVEAARLERRFQAGMKEVGAYVDGLKLDEMKLIRGDVREQARSDAGVRRLTPEYRTAAIHTGERDAPVAAWAGDVKFSLTVRTPPHVINTVDANGRPVTRTEPSTKPPVQVTFDLSEVGPPEARTVAAVVKHLNDKLAVAGLMTRFSREQLPQAPRTMQVGERTVTLPAGPDQWALKIAGVSSEALDFSAPDAADAVYITQTTGRAVRDDPAAQSRQLLKFQTDQVTGAPPPALQTAEGHWVEGRAFARGMDPDIAAVRASATGPDGAVYTLAEVTGEVLGQDIKGARDVALLKYDSTGLLLWTRTLGAADTAGAGAIAVGPDGKVAIGGSVTGVLRDAGAVGSLNAAQPDSFVTVFDAEGSELWTRRGGAIGADEVQALAFGADGSVYAAGQTSGAMPGGGAAAADKDGYLRGWDATGKETFTRQFGTAGSDGASALAIEGGALVTAGVENGRAVVRRFDLAAAGGPAQTAVRDLGDLAGGTVKAVALEGGRLTVAGSTRVGGLSGAEANRFNGGLDAFVSTLDGSLAAGAADRVSYWGGAGEDEVSAVAIRAGQVWLTGSSRGEIAGTTKLGERDAFVARMDTTTGAVDWTRRWTAKDGEAAPAAIAVGAGGASVLDRLGLPTGTIDYSGAQDVAASTSARAGDRFYLRVNGGRQIAITLEPGDTLKSLADRINRTAGFNVRAEVGRSVGLQTPGGSNLGGVFDRLDIKPRNDRTTVELIPGEGDRDLLGALGLMDGVVRRTVRDSKGKEVVPDEGKTYGLKLARDLTLESKVEVKRTLDELNTAMNTIRMAYRALVDAGKPETTKPPVTGTAPLWMQKQAANYQAALDRLGG